MSVLGNIALRTKRENPDLVENISIANVEVFGCQRADGAIVKRCARKKPPRHGDEYAKDHAQRERKNPYMVDVYG